MNRLSLTPLSASVAIAEDGAGRLVPARRPVALDLHADPEAWPGRALDPVLTVGNLHFHHYEHPAPGILRFVAADASALAAGSEVSLQWGDDVGSRIVVTQHLEVSP